MPLAVCSGQRHPGSCQWQQTHPIQVSGSPTEQQDSVSRVALCPGGLPWERGS